jgi:uncharacterized membrane protein
MVYVLRKFIHFFVGKHICLYCTPHGFCVFGQKNIGVYKDNQMVVIFGV